MNEPKKASLSIVKRKRFLDLNIGALFVAHDQVWVRTSYDGATTIDTNSACNFVLDPEDEYVLAVDGSIVAEAILENKRILFDK